MCPKAHPPFCLRMAHIPFLSSGGVRSTLFFMFYNTKHFASLFLLCLNLYFASHFVIIFFRFLSFFPKNVIFS